MSELILSGHHTGNPLHNESANVGAIRAHGISENGQKDPYRSKEFIECNGNDRGRCGATDIGLAPDSNQEERRFDDAGYDDHNQSMYHDPDTSDEEKFRVIEQRLQVHAHPDGRNQYIEEEGTHVGGAITFQVFRFREGQEETERCSNDNDPEKATGK